MVDQVVQLVKYGIYYIVSCGDLGFLSEEGHAMISVVKEGATMENVEKHVDDAVDKATSSPAESSSSSHGAITSLYAGTAPQAGDLNGKVGIHVLRFAHDSWIYV
jgi:hypothetical protein